MAAHFVAQLGAAAAAAAASPGCLDAAQSGSSLWAAARSADHSVLVTHAAAAAAGGGSSGPGSVHSTVVLPEPVAVVHVGAPTDAAQAGSAVLVVVGVSCRVWAFHLRPHPPPGRVASRQLPAEVAAEDGTAVVVLLAHTACTARHQLAAAVAWEHLCYCWTPDAALSTGQQQGSHRGGGRGAGNNGSAGSVVPISLVHFEAAVQQYRCSAGSTESGMQQQHPAEQPMLLLHSVASWACQPPASAAGIPSDATAAAYVGVASTAGGMQPRLVCTTRFELPAAAAAAVAAAGGGSTAPTGYLLVATAGGQLLALPVGTPRNPQRQQQQQQQQAPGRATGPKLPVAICYTSGSTGSGSIHVLAPVPISGSSPGSSPSPCELVLLPEAGQLAEAQPAGLGTRQVELTSVGGSSGSIASNGSSSGGGGGGAGYAAMDVFAATVQLVGVQAAATVGGRLWYVLAGSGDDGSGGGKAGMRCLDTRRGLVHAAAVQAPFDAGTTGVYAALAAPAAAGSSVMALTTQGTLLALPASARQDGGSAEEVEAAAAASLSVRRLERTIQGLLGGIARLSAQQEHLDWQLLSLDASVAGLGAAIPAAQAVAAHVPTGATGGRLHCTVKLLGLSSQLLGASIASSSSDSSGSSSQELLTLRISLLNQSRLPLAGSWSLLLTFNSGSSSSSSSNKGSGGRGGRSNKGSGGSSSGGQVAIAAPLGGLAAGSQWRQEFQLPLPHNIGSDVVGQLRVLLCHHGSSNRIVGSGCRSSASTPACALLLHSVQLDALHLLQLSSSIVDRGSGKMHHHHQAVAAAAGAGGAGGGAAVFQLKLLLQLPVSMCGVGPSAGQLLGQLLDQGLSSQGLHYHHHQQQQQRQPLPLFPAFSLLLPRADLHPSGSGGSKAVVAAGSVELSAHMVPGSSGAWGSGPGSQLLQVTAAASDCAALLACHSSLCRRALHWQQAAAAGVGGGDAPLWPQLPGGGVLLPPVAATAVGAASEADLEQALLHLRRLKEAAMRLRNAAAEPRAGLAAGQEQRWRRQQQQQLLELILAARSALARVPVCLS